MNISLRRYTPEMLASLSQQSLLSLTINALMRGVAFMLMVQVLTLLSGFTISNSVQMIILALIFSLFVFSFDVLEKYWAQNRLNKLHRQ